MEQVQIVICSGHNNFCMWVFHKPWPCTTAQGQLKTNDSQSTEFLKTYSCQAFFKTGVSPSMSIESWWVKLQWFTTALQANMGCWIENTDPTCLWTKMSRLLKQLFCVNIAATILNIYISVPQALNTIEKAIIDPWMIWPMFRTLK